MALKFHVRVIIAGTVNDRAVVLMCGRPLLLLGGEIVVPPSLPLPHATVTATFGGTSCELTVSEGAKMDTWAVAQALE